MKIISNTIQNTKSFYERNEKAIDAGVFFGGFFFDIFTLGRIDDTFNILQQLIYITLLGFLIVYEVRIEVLKQKISPRLEKVWQYRRIPIHFFLGSLLSVYTLFFFKSGSFITSFLFLLIIASLMVLNELPFIQNLGTFVRVVIHSLCLGSFWAINFPLILGFIGWIPFLLAMTLSAAISMAVYKILLRSHKLPIEATTSKNPIDKLTPLQRSYLLPSIGTYVFFFLFYVFGFVPPVPLSIDYIGIYHKIEKREDKYELYYTRPKWKFWQNGDQTFYAQPGDKINCFVQIYAPKNFHDQIFLKWYYDDPKIGWQTWDSIPLTISGGRETGFRGFGTKQNFQPGDWQVRAVTSDQREIGRINFTVEAEDPTDTRQSQIDVF